MLLDFILCSNKSQNMDKVMRFVCFLNDCHTDIRRQAPCTAWILLFYVDTAGIFRDYQKALCLVLRLSGHSFSSAAITTCHGSCQRLVSTSLQQWQLCSGGLQRLKNLIWAQFSKERENRGKQSSQPLFLHSKEKQSPGMATASPVPGAGKQLLQGVTALTSARLCGAGAARRCPGAALLLSGLFSLQNRQRSFVNSLSSGMTDSVVLNNETVSPHWNSFPGGILAWLHLGFLLVAPLSG